jgi:hydroxyacylglutathione hydrolase
MNLLALPAFTDNYIWMLHDGQRAVVVDPGDCAPVVRTLETLNLRLSGILVTHHHTDHTGGIPGLMPWLDGEIYAPQEAIAHDPFVRVCGEESIQLLGRQVRVLATPGHTLGHVCYLWNETSHSKSPDILFCGDTLFSAGCGRLFEGTAEQMYGSLSMLSELAAETLVCCAHEYTVGNLRFAASAEPGNSAVISHQAHCLQLRERGQPTLPSSIGLELQINPFLRCTQPDVIDSALRRGSPGAHPASVFSTLRQWKNAFP